MVSEKQTMPKKKINANRSKETVRASISFDSEDYEQLEQLAAEKKVSLAWVVREAVSLYIQDDVQGNQTPTGKV